jgi:hypothetical protein
LRSIFLPNTLISEGALALFIKKSNNINATFVKGVLALKEISKLFSKNTQIQEEKTNKLDKLLLFIY